MRSLQGFYGKKFNKLTIIKKVGTDKQGKSVVRCLCDCGEKKDIAFRHVKSGHNKSCGCLSGEKHNMTASPEYASWKTMMQRCKNKNKQSYKNYGERGIKVCKRWNSFSCFYEDMGERPPNATLDRIDNNGNYEPKNCRWATHSEQQRNTSRSVMVTYKNKTLPICSWAEILGLKDNTLRWRKRSGWSDEMTILTPVRGKTVSKRLCKALGLPE